MNTDKTTNLGGKIRNLEIELDALFASVQCACGEIKVERNFLKGYDLLREAKQSTFKALDLLDEILALKK